MSDEFLFGFDLDAMQDDDDNNIPPAENELKPESMTPSDGDAIQFVDARFYKEKPMDIFANPFGIVSSIHYNTDTEQDGDIDDDDDDGPVTRTMTGSTNATQYTSKRNSQLMATREVEKFIHAQQARKASNYLELNINNNSISQSVATHMQHSLNLDDHDFIDGLMDIVDAFGDDDNDQDTDNNDEPYYDENTPIKNKISTINQTKSYISPHHKSYTSRSTNRSLGGNGHYQSYSRSTNRFSQITKKHSLLNNGLTSVDETSVIFDDSDFDTSATEDDEYNFEECGIGLEDKTLPFDFEKPLRFKPMSTVVIDLNIQRIRNAISKTTYKQFTEFDSSSSDDQYDSSSSDNNNNDNDNLGQKIKKFKKRTQIKTQISNDSDSSYSSYDENDYYGMKEYNLYNQQYPIIQISKIEESISYVDDCEYDIIISPDPEISGILTRPDSAPPFNKFKRFFSMLKPEIYDIVLMESSPLRIFGIDNSKDIKRESLEYLQCSLNDQDKLYEKIWQTFLRNSFEIRCGNLNGNISNIKKLAQNGGCHILQFVGHCCNPIKVIKDMQYFRDKDEEKYELNKYYHDLTKHIKSPLNEYYILLEYDINSNNHNNNNDDKKHIIDGKWYPISQLKKHFIADKNDLLIVMSPFHEEMADIFINMNYSYVVAIRTAIQSLQNTSHNWQILDFLHHFYSAILNQECLQRAFDLAKTATRATFYDIKSHKEQKLLVKRVERLEGNQGIQFSESKLSNDDDEEFIDETDINFILKSPKSSHLPSSDRFILFHQLPRGEPIDQNGSMLKHTRYQTNWNNIILKPFIGRSIQVIQLFNALIENKMIMVYGRENDGRKSIIKRLIAWLYEHNYFDDGLFVLDCKSELMHKKPFWKFRDILCFKLSQLGYNLDQQQQQQQSIDDTLNSQHRLFSRGTILDDKNDSYIPFVPSISAISAIPKTPSMNDLLKAIEKYNICFVFFNIDCWPNDEIYHFMDEFATKNKNPQSPCIFTMKYDDNKNIATQYFESKANILSKIPTTLNSKQYAKSQLVDRDSQRHSKNRSSIIDDLIKGPQAFYQMQKSMLIEKYSKKNMLEMFNEKHKFKIIKIEGLNKKDITELFVQLCYFEFTRDDVEKHEEIHQLFQGKPGNVKKVAAFYQFLSKTQLNQDDDDKISLDNIVHKLNNKYQGWMNDFHKTVPKYFKDSSRTIGSHLGSLRHFPADIKIDVSKPRKRNSSNKKKHNIDNTLIINPIISEENEENEYDQFDNKLYNIFNKAQTLNELMPVLKAIHFQTLKDIIRQGWEEKNSLSDDYNINGVGLIIEEDKDTPDLIIKESNTNQSIEDQEIIYNDEWNNIWNVVCDHNNRKYAQFNDLYNPLIQQFQNITKLKKIIFSDLRLNKWFKMVTNGQINNGKIYKNDFELFWKWFIGMSYIVKDLYGDNENYKNNIDLDIFHIKENAQIKLLNEKIGTFMPILNYKKCNQLIVLYKRKKTNFDKEIGEIKMTRKQDNIYIIDNKKQKYFDYIHNNNLNLKKLYSKSSGSIDSTKTAFL